MPLISLDDDDQRWVPTHVNVTVLRARGLRTKSKHGSRYVYTIIQVGKEKYTTGLVEKADVPEWNEECSFELLPGLLEAGGTTAYPPGSSNLVLTVMHRVLIGLDVFLGQTIIALDKVFQDGMCPRNEWLKLRSKPGQKEKERGELQVTVQFTRNNMTASMYDLTVKDKPRSTFGKLKDRMTGRKRGDVESSSAILPGRYAALSSSLGQPFGEGGGEEFPAEEEVGDERKNKMKDFLLKGRLRKNSDTQSCLSLASDSSVTSSGGEPFSSVQLSSTPIYSSRIKIESSRTDTDGGIKVFTSPKVMTHKRAYSDEASKITAGPRPNTAVETLKGQSVFSKSSLCINGSHIYTSEPASPKSPSSLPSRRALLEKCSPLSRSLQNLTRRTEDSQRTTLGDGRRWSIDKTKKDGGEGETSVSQTQGASLSESQPVQSTASPSMAAAGSAEAGDKGKKSRKTLFSSGRSDSLPAKAEQSQASATHEGRFRGWFSSSESQNKPRLDVSPKVESSSDTPLPLPSCSPSQPPRSLPLASATGHVSPGNGHHTNPFTNPAPVITNPISPSNPFLMRMQRNPFFEELIAEEALKSPTSSSCYPSSPYYHPSPFPVCPANGSMQNKMAAIKRERPRSVARQRSLPALLPATPGTATTTSSSHSLSENGGEWDESFEAFAASRLKSPKGTPTSLPSESPCSQTTNFFSLEGPADTPKNETTVEPKFDKELNRPVDFLPPLPPRRQNRTPIRERCSDSWLDRAQELAVQKEACLLSQTDFASLQHAREEDQKRNIQCSPLSQELFTETVMSDIYHGPQEQTEMICPSRLTPDTMDMHNGENLNALGKRDAQMIFSQRHLSPDMAEIHCVNNTIEALNSLACDVPEDTAVNNPLNCPQERILQNSFQAHSNSTAFDISCYSCDCQVSPLAESPCLSQKTYPKPDFKAFSEPDQDQGVTFQQQNINNTNNVLSLLSSQDPNNNSTDNAEFSYIDSDSSSSEVTQRPCEIVDKGSREATKKHQDHLNVDSSGSIMPLPRNSPQSCDLLSRMTSEIETFSPTKSCMSRTHANKTSEQSKITTHQPNSKHFEVSSFLEGICQSPGGCDFNMTTVGECGQDLSDRSTSYNCSQKSPVLGLKTEKEGSVTKETAETKHTSSDSDETDAIRNEGRENGTHIGKMFCDGGQPAESKTANRNTEPSLEKNTEVEESDSEYTEKISFKDLHARVAPALRNTKSPSKTGLALRPSKTDVSPYFCKTECNVGYCQGEPITVASECNTSGRPFETNTSTNPSKTVTDASKTDTTIRGSKTDTTIGATSINAASELFVHDLAISPCSLLNNTKTQPLLDPTPHLPLPDLRPVSGSSLAVTPHTTSNAQPRVDAQHKLLPEETQPASSLIPCEESSPHPVKPLTTTAVQGERKSEGRSVLEKLKSTIHPGRSSQQTVAETEKTQESVMEARAQYQNMTNMELISLLLQQEMDVEKQRAASEQQMALLEKREAELRKMKVQVRDLEDYIDKLLVRIMEQTPNLLQVRSRYK